MKNKLFDRDKIALWYFLGSLLLGTILLVAQLLRSYFEIHN